MKLTIISAEKVVTEEIAWLEANTIQGNFVIQAEHEPTTFLLVPGKEFIFRLKTGKQKIWLLEQGAILDVTRTTAQLLLPLSA